jgi:ketosteroid isomerase-like protein
MTRGPAPSLEPFGSTCDSEVAAVLAAYADFERGDIDAAVADLAPDVQWTEPEEFPNGGTYRGPVAVAEYLWASRAMWREIRGAPNRVPARRTHRRHPPSRRHARRRDTACRHCGRDVYIFHNGRVVTMHA